MTKFTPATEAKPGFTTAATEHFTYINATGEWPDQILGELDPVVDPSWIDQHIGTFGPLYGPDEPATHIAFDYIVGIQEWIRRGRLQSILPFVQCIIANLEAISSGFPGQHPVTAKPHSDAENELLNALQLALPSLTPASGSGTK